MPPTRGATGPSDDGPHRGARVRRVSNQLQQMKAWGPAAHEMLVETAGRYHSTITYQQLANGVQQRTGITTRSLMMNWIGQLLEVVALHAHDAGEPPLTSLVVRSDGTVSDSYERTTALTTGGLVTDLQMRAAEDRLVCYSRYASDLPSDGGEPRLTTQEAQRRERLANAPRPVTPKAYGSVCPRCFMERSVAGSCDNCD